MRQPCSVPAFDGLGRLCVQRKPGRPDRLIGARQGSKKIPKNLEAGQPRGSAFRLGQGGRPKSSGRLMRGVAVKPIGHAAPKPSAAWSS
jgi:hypothetical protein